MIKNRVVKLMAVVLSFGLPALAQTTITNIYVKDKSGSAQTNAPVTFALPFAKGAVASGATLSARLTDNTPVPLQVIKKATHVNGTLRHAIFSLKMPSLSANEKKTVQIYAGGTAPSGRAVSLSDVLATSFDATVTITPSDGSTFTVSARNLLQNTTPVVWQSGPIASEWIVKKTDAHDFIAVYFHIRAYAGCQTIRVDAIVENCWTFKPGWGNLMYNVTMASGGNTVYSKEKFFHYSHSRWHQTFFWGTAPKTIVSFDRGHLFRTHAVPNYDTTIVLPSSTNTSFQTEYVPMGTSVVYPSMPTTGGRADIGPFPKWAALYLLTMRDTLWNTILAVGGSAGSFSIHYRDDTLGNVLSTADHPNFFVHSNYRPGTNVNTLPAPGPSYESPYTADGSHQPMMAYLPYLLSGDYFYLEEMEYWVTKSAVFGLPIYHGYEKGLVSAGDTRGMAWCMRELGQLAFIMPDDHPQKAHCNMRVNANLDDFAVREENNPLGISVCSYGPTTVNNRLAYPPWQHDMFVWSMGYLAYMEAWPKAKEQLEFVAKFNIGRMVAPDFCWIYACSYFPVIADTLVKKSEVGSYYSTFGEFAAGNRWDVSNCRTTGNMVCSTGNDYPDQMRAAMSYVSKLSTPGAQEACTKFNTLVNTLPSGTDTWYNRPVSFSQWAVAPPADPLYSVSVEQYNVSAEKEELLSCHPNPFNPSVTIRLDGLSRDAGVRLVVYNVAGHQVADLSSAAARFGKVEWNASGNASGLYVVKAIVGKKSLTNKIMLVK